SQQPLHQPRRGIRDPLSRVLVPEVLQARVGVDAGRDDDVASLALDVDTWLQVGSATDDASRGATKNKVTAIGPGVSFGSPWEWAVGSDESSERLGATVPRVHVHDDQAASSRHAEITPPPLLGPLLDRLLVAGCLLRPAFPARLLRRLSKWVHTETDRREVK